MAGRGRQIGGLVLCLMGVLGVCVVCGLPMWRETSFVGANVVTAQSVWDGLWLHCVVQATGQMQCKRHGSPVTMTADIQAGRALILLSILTGLMGFIVTLLGGGACCKGRQSQDDPPGTLSSSKAKMSIAGGSLCLLSGILCLVSVSWSASNTVYTFNDPLVIQAMKREVGSSIYIGLASSLLLLLGGVMICAVCTRKKTSSTSYQTYAPYTYSYNSQYTRNPSPPSIARSTRQEYQYPYLPEPDRVRPVENHKPKRVINTVAQVYNNNSLKKAPIGSEPYDQSPERTRSIVSRRSDRGMDPNVDEMKRKIPSRTSSVPKEYYYNMPDVKGGDRISAPYTV